MGAKGSGKPGRPERIDEKMLEKLERAFSYGMSNDEACLECNLARSTLQDYFTKNPNFKERVEMLKNRPVTIARKCVVDGLTDDSELSLKYLERKCRVEFNPKAEIEANITFEPFTVIIEK